MPAPAIGDGAEGSAETRNAAGPYTRMGLAWLRRVADGAIFGNATTEAADGTPGRLQTRLLREAQGATSQTAVFQLVHIATLAGTAQAIVPADRAKLLFGGRRAAAAGRAHTGAP